MVNLLRNLATKEKLSNQEIDTRFIASALSILSPHFLKRLIELLKIPLKRTDKSINQELISTDEFHDTYYYINNPNSMLQWFQQKGILTRSYGKKVYKYKIEDIEKLYKLINFLEFAISKYGANQVLRIINTFTFLEDAVLRNASTGEDTPQETGRMRALVSISNMLIYISNLNLQTNLNFTYQKDYDYYNTRRVLIELGLIEENEKLTKLGIQSVELINDLIQYWDNSQEVTITLEQLQNLENNFVQKEG